jgi:TFIIF-interacting CTD phosphatase-like protein
LRVVLDLDETIINANEKDLFNFKKNTDKMEKFTYHDMDGYYIVFERPGLQEFLDYLFKNYIVSVWTAATKDYAIFVVKNILKPSKDRKLDFLLFSNHCEYCKDKRNGGMKDLNLLWEDFNMDGYTRENTVIIDDYNKVYNTNSKKNNNCYKIKPFIYKSKNSIYDNELENVKKYIEEMKSNLK